MANCTDSIVVDLTPQNVQVDLWQSPNYVIGLKSYIYNLQFQAAGFGPPGPAGPPGADSTVPGPPGAPGGQGLPGAAATVAVGSTSTLSPGAPATVTNSGSSSAATFNFGIPAGVAGATGATGATGSPGSQGPVGNTGAAGAAATIAVGTTSTLSPGTSATVTNSGSSSAATFNFGIPAGVAGATGATGATGSPGTPGADGANSWTLTTANFTVPPVNSTVVVNVADTSWAVVGEYVWVATAGGSPSSPMALQITAKTGTTVTLLNPPTAGMQVSGDAGNLLTLGSDSLTYLSKSAIQTAAAGTSYFDPRNGFYLYEDFLWYAGASSVVLPSEWNFQAGTNGGSVTAQDPNHLGSNSTNKAQGNIFLFTGGATTGASNGGTLARGINASAYNAITLGLGAFEMAARIWITDAGGTLFPTTGYGFGFTFGLWLQGGLGDTQTTANLYAACIMKWEPDQNSGNLRQATAPGPLGTINTLTYRNCTGTITAGYHWWSMKVSTAGNVTVSIDGTVIGTFNAVAPLNLSLIPIFAITRNASNSTNWSGIVDALYIYQSYTR